MLSPDGGEGVKRNAFNCGKRMRSISLERGGSFHRNDSRAGMKASLNHVNAAMTGTKWPLGQQIMVTEFYVTPGDVGVPIGTDMYPFHAIAFDLLKASGFSHVVAWGLRPDERDHETNAWARFGGVGNSLVKWRG